MKKTIERASEDLSNICKFTANQQPIVSVIPASFIRETAEASPPPRIINRNLGLLYGAGKNDVIERYFAQKHSKSVTYFSFFSQIYTIIPIPYFFIAE